MKSVWSGGFISLKAVKWYGFALISPDELLSAY